MNSTNSPRGKIWVIIPSAGVGSRMKSEIPKQYLHVNNKMVIEHTLTTFINNDDIHKITVCIAEDDQHWAKLDVSKHKNVQSTIGGKTRANSVLNGLNHILEDVDDNDWVMVHDAARPCLPPELLKSMITKLHNDPVGGVLAIPAIDTIKLSTGVGLFEIKETLNREQVWSAQTPQMFRYKILKDALDEQLNESSNESMITDESSAVERAGHTVQLVYGSEINIKLTNQYDLTLASHWLNDNED